MSPSDALAAAFALRRAMELRNRGWSHQTPYPKPELLRLPAVVSVKPKEQK